MTVGSTPTPCPSKRYLEMSSPPPLISAITKTVSLSHGTSSQSQFPQWSPRRPIRQPLIHSFIHSFTHWWIRRLTIHSGPGPGPDAKHNSSCLQGAHRAQVSGNRNPEMSWATWPRSHLVGDRQRPRVWVQFPDGGSSYHSGELPPIPTLT